MSKYEIVENALNELNDSQVVIAWNEYCENNRYDDNRINYIEELDDFCVGLSALQIIEHYGTLDTTCRYFVDGIYSSESFDDPWSVIVEEDLINYIIDNDCDLGFRELREALFECEDEEDEEE